MTFPLGWNFALRLASRDNTYCIMVSCLAPAAEMANTRAKRGRTVRKGESAEEAGAATSYFGGYGFSGGERGELPSGWEEARKVTSILVDAATPKDGYTAEHAVEVARLSRLIGMDLGLSEEELEWLVHGALLHDLGKLGVAEQILEKPGPLTEEEWAAVKRHPEIGARMIEPIEILRGAIPVVREHHERPDGTGYPDGLEGEETPLGARICAAVDAYDVMLRGRPYRSQRYGRQISSAEALQELSREAGRQFDVRVVEAMRRLLGIQPMGSPTDSPGIRHPR
jgi:HD-GYP domain-containing protein (c-di-GMP phosphodiesterase class II)